MPTPLRRSLASFLPLIAVVVACRDGGGSVLPPAGGGLRPIASATWHMHTANATALPTKVSERFIGVVFEEIYVDSSQLTVDASEQTYIQRYWLRVNHSGVEDRKEFVIDEGTFTATPAAYTFMSQYRARALVVEMPTITELESTEPMVFFSGAAPVEGSYRLHRP